MFESKNSSASTFSMHAMAHKRLRKLRLEKIDQE
jgi:hypothetical protein